MLKSISNFSWEEFSTRNNLYFRVAYYIFVHALALLAFKYATLTTFFTFKTKSFILNIILHRNCLYNYSI